MHTHFTLWMKFLHLQTICITDLYDCVNPYTVIIWYVFYAYTCSTSYCLMTALGIYGMYICITIIHMNGMAITEREYNGGQV